jgi:hypothetical protein
MLTNKLGSFAVGSLMVVALGVACSSDENDGGASPGGAAGKSSSLAGTGNKAGSSSTPSGASGGAGGAALGGEAGAETTMPGGAGGAAAGTSGSAGDGNVPEGGAGGSGGEAASCETVRAGLLGPIDTVSTGLVQVTSDANAALVTMVIDASAGGYMAAANNPYIYVSLAAKARVDVSDRQADSSAAWDLALKRDNIRSNGGDSGPGNAQVAALVGADFDTTTATAATDADFAQDSFIDPATCEPSVDAVGKPLTTFDGWYDYDAATNGVAPADRVYLVRGANGTSLYKLKITGYYVDVPDGQGGTVKKSAVFALQYQAL